MKILHGIDLTSIKRSEFNDLKMVNKILHPNEFEVYKGIENELKARFVAKHWAIKEALFKAYSHPYGMNKIEIIKVNEQLIATIDGIEFLISISYEQDFVLASALSLIA